MNSRRNNRSTNGDSSSHGTTDAARSPATGSNLDSRSRAISRMDKDLEGKRNRISDERIRALSEALTVCFKNAPHASQLKPEKVDFHKEENREAHKTDDYDAAYLIIRRGQEFDVTVTFNREYNPGTDEILLQFVTGSRPQESKGSIVRVVLRDALKPTEWGMKIKKISGKTMRLTVMPSAKAIIGQYEVFVETKMKGTAPGKKSVFRYKDDDKVCILFNAWCKDDAAYMENDEERNEYVLAEFGYIWVGSAKSNGGIPWIFGQFEDVALDCALWLLDKDGLSPTARSSPIHVARTMSAMTNFNDYDGGILVGRWTKTYPDDCTRPTAWTGSVAILEEFWKNKDMMCGVKYGQCWVFSGLVTTLLRALGLPTRSVTNFESAHDTDGSMTIDFHFDEEGNPVDDFNDSVWNFHVWNESWFKRPDLPDGHDGWQAYDATPQETSEGAFRCGPASVNAIKKGEVYLPYDTSFIFAEVNGDRVYWEMDEDDGSMKAFRVDAHSVGKSISTKKPGAYLRRDAMLRSGLIQEDAYASYDVRNDVTSNYKNPDGSREERDVVEFAFKYSTRKEYEIYQADEEDVNFSLEVLDSVPMGDSFEVKVVAQNKSNDKRTVKVNITSVMAFYTGIRAKPLKGRKETLSVNAKGEKSVVLKIAATDYMGKLAGDGNIKLYIKATVEETGQRYATQDVVEMKKPKLVVTTTPEVVKKGEMVKVTASFKNLAVILTNGQFHFEATGMLPKSVVVYCPANVTSGEEAKATATFTATRAKERIIGVSFVSDQLAGVRGECTVKVN